MPNAKDVKNIVIHCSAGFGNVDSIRKYWKEVLKWKSVGYHLIVDLSGNIHTLADFKQITNGVEGNNGKSIHICYIGGVEVAGKDKNGQTIYKGKDTRTASQKYALDKAIIKAINWLVANGKDVTKDLAVVGHRDFSPDNDKNGIISSWERIKECPSFDAITEYICYTSLDRKGKLPNFYPATPDKFIVYSVVPGDTLSKIAAKYKTTVSKIKSDNELKTDVIQIGQKLKI